MSTYQTDDEQVEAIKKWWRENGRSVIGGIVLGFAVIGGWQFWQGYQRDQSEAASQVFDAMRLAVRNGNLDQAIVDGKRLVGDFGGTSYAAFAGLELARISYERGEKAAARNHLRWVADSAPERPLRELARLRLARLLYDIRDLDALRPLLAETPLPAFAGEFAVLRGDLARAEGDAAAARAAYQDALSAGVADEMLLRMKLVDVGGALPAS